MPCKDREEDTGGAKTHFICALQLVATATPKQRPRGLILSLTGFRGVTILISLGAPRW